MNQILINHFEWNIEYILEAFDFNKGIHDHTVCNKIAKGMFLIRKLRYEVTLDVLKVIYFSYIYPHILYGILLWGNDPNIKRILILQKKAIKIMCNVNVRTHSKPLFKKLNILTVTSLYIIECLMYVKKKYRYI